MLILVFFQLFILIVIFTTIWLALFKGYKTQTGRVILRSVFVILLLFFLWEFWNRILPENIFGIISDVSRRLASPDRSKIALLIRRQAFDLNFKVKVNKKVLFYSGDYVPDLTVNWNENIEWSADSSLLVLSIHDPDANEPFKWAYDFKQQKDISDTKMIDALWNDRNKEPKHAETSSNNCE